MSIQDKIKFFENLKKEEEQKTVLIPPATKLVERKVESPKPSTV